MRVEELIYKRIREWQGLADMLALYSGVPAIFYQTVPSDQQDDWGGKSQYPRIIFDLNMQANTERKASGSLAVLIFCESTGTDPESIAPLVSDCLKDLILMPEDASPIAFAWSRSDPFELERNQSNVKSKRSIVGLDLRFDLLEYPEQVTTDPDPIATVNEHLKAKFPEAYVIGLDEQIDMLEPTMEAPVIYIRAVTSEVDHQSYALSWMNCKMAVHIFAPDPHSRGLWARRISNHLAVEPEAVMSDGSPLLATKVTANNTFDYLANGQITIDTRYSLVRIGPTNEGAANITIPRR